MLTRDQILAVVERIVKTVAQSLIAFVVAAGATGVTEVDWGQALSVASLAGLLSLLTSVASWKVGTPGPSVGPEAPVDELIVSKENH